MHHGFTSIVGALSVVASPVMAQTHDHGASTDCKTALVKLPVDLAGWAEPQSARAANTAEMASAVNLIVGQAFDLELHPTPSITYTVPSARPGGAASSSGIATFRIDTAGAYRVVAENAVWLDVVLDGQALKAINHSHGPACSGIRKMVDFQLEPGVYILQLVGSVTPHLRVMVTSVSGA